MRILLAVLLLLLLMVQYRLWFGDGGLLSIWELHGAVEEQREENRRLEERNKALEAEVRDLKKGLEAIEERARADLGMVKKDETFYQVIEE